MSKIIVALDYDNEMQAWGFIERVTPELCRLKIGKELFCATGFQFVQKVVNKGFDVFLDLKFYDIPNTVSSVLKVVTDMGVWMVNVHASGGAKMMTSAMDTLHHYSSRPLLIGVTVLTSMGNTDLMQTGINLDTNEQVMKLATLAKESGLDGVVSSANEVAQLKKQLGYDFLAVTPGIRPQGSKIDDQNRVMTPKEAVLEGSDYLVIGRPITKSQNAKEALLEILTTIEFGTEGRT